MARQAGRPRGLFMSVRSRPTSALESPLNFEPWLGDREHNEYSALTLLSNYKATLFQSGKKKCFAIIIK